jgi:hypothetical protein
MKRALSPVPAAVALWLLAMPVAQAQPAETAAAAVEGVVGSAATGASLAGAHVLVEGVGAANGDVRRGGAADEEGAFRVAGLPAGRYRVRASYLGYRAAEKQIALDAGETRRLPFSLQTAALEGEDIVVTGEGAAERAERALGAERLTPAEIKELPTPFEPDVFRALQLLPGVKAASDFSSGLYIRGGSPDQTLVRLGETTVYNPTHFFGFFSTFNPDAIGDVRLYKGGFPALYGGRLGAVVDLQNRRGSTENISGTASIGLLASRIAADGPLPDALAPADTAGGAWMLAARRSTVEPLFAVLRGQDVDGIPNDFHFYDLNARADVPLSGRDRLTVSGYAGADYLDFSFLDDARVEVPYGNRTATLRWRHLFEDGALGDRAFSDVSVSASRYFSRPRFELAGNTFRRSNELTDLAASADLEVRAGAHTLRGGARGSVFTSALERSLDGEVLFGPTIQTGRVSVYAQDTWRPGSELGGDGGSYRPWRITGGLRATYHTRGGFLRLAPRLSAQYRPRQLFGTRLDGRVRLQAGYGRYYQYLTVLSSSFFSGADTWYAAGEGVPPAYGDQFVGGVKIDLADAWRLDVEGYYRTMRDLFEIDRYIQDTAGLPYEEAFWFGEGHAQGLEVKLERTDGPVTGFLAYTFAQTRRRFPNLNLEEGRQTDLAGLNAQNALGGSYPPKYDRRHDLKAVLNYDFADQWRATSVFTYATGQPYTRPEAQYKLVAPPQRGSTLDVLVSPFNGARLPAYHRLDLGVRRLGDVFGLDYELQVQLLNVYNRRNPWFYFYDTGGDTGITREEVPQLPIPLPNVALTVEF